MFRKLIYVGLVVLLGIGGESRASLVSENRLHDPAVIDGSPKIEFENVRLKYRPDQSERRSPGVASVVAWGKFRSEYALFAPGFDGVEFDGNFALHARIGRHGELLGGLGFGIFSRDPLLGYGATERCIRRECFNTPQPGLLMGGVLTEFGWSKSLGILEFKTSDLEGWACDQGWCDQEETLVFSVNGGIRQFLSSVRHRSSLITAADGFVTSADNMASVPVPPAVWLLSSGLLGLFGIARRKKPASQRKNPEFVVTLS